MTPQEAYKIGFLSRCAEEGLTPDQTEARIKTAAAVHPDGLVKAADGEGLAGWVSWPFRKAFRIGTPLAVAAPPLAGVLGGYALAQAGDDTFSLEEAKKREEIAEYERAIERLARSMRQASPA